MVETFNFALFFLLLILGDLVPKETTTVPCIYIEVYLVPYTQRFMSPPWQSDALRIPVLGQNKSHYKGTVRHCQLEILKMIMGLSYMKHHDTDLKDNTKVI